MVHRRYDADHPDSVMGDRNAIVEQRVLQLSGFFRLYEFCLEVATKLFFIDPWGVAQRTIRSINQA
jgi:hypothetical protein